MDNRYMKLLEQLTVEQLHREAVRTSEQDPGKTSLVYDQLIERAEEFNEKLRFQRLASRYENKAKEGKLSSIA